MPYSTPIGYSGLSGFRDPSPSFIYIDRGYSPNHGDRFFTPNAGDDLNALKVAALIGAAIFVGYGIYNTYNRKEPQRYMSGKGRLYNGDWEISHGPLGSIYTASKLDSVNTLQEGKSVTLSRYLGLFGFLCITGTCVFSRKMNSTAIITISLIALSSIIGQHSTIPFIHRKPMSADEYTAKVGQESNHRA